MRRIILFIICLLLATNVYAGYKYNPFTGKMDLYPNSGDDIIINTLSVVGTGTSEIPDLDVSTTLNIPNSTSLPATCVTGDIYMDTDATSGQRIYACQSANTWILQGDGGGAGGGDNVTVNSIAIDTTANIKDSADITWTITDGGAGGPDDIAGTVVDDSHAHTTTSISSIDIGDDTNLAGTSNEITLTGDTLSLAATVDLGGKTSFEVPNGADLTLDAAGEIGVNSTHKGLAWYDGTQEVFQPSLHILQGTMDLAGWYDNGPTTHELWIMDLDAGTFPHGIYITAVSVDCSAADPTTEIDADLKYCDAVANGAFPGANATVIQALDTTTGNMANAAVNTAVASTKSLYILLNADPTDANVVYHLKVTYYIPES